MYAHDVKNVFAFGSIHVWNTYDDDDECTSRAAKASSFFSQFFVSFVSHGIQSGGCVSCLLPHFCCSISVRPRS